MSDAKTIKAYDTHAADYARRFAALKVGKHLQMFMEALPAGGRALDLGRGPGNTSVMLMQAGFEVEATDASAAMVEVAQSHNVAARQERFDELSAQAAFDGVWANFSLLHAPRADLDRHLAAIARALRPQGVFHIGMKTGDGAARDRLDRAYTYYDIGDLRDRLRRAGFEVLSERKGEDLGLAGDVEPWVVMLARKSHG